MKLNSEKGNLLVFQHPEGEKTGVERWKGFEAATADAPFNVLGTEYGANDPETGYEKGSQVIPRFKDQGIDFLYVSNQQAANGIIRALKENGIKPGKDVKIVSSDCSGSLEAVKNGETFGTGLQSGAIEGSSVSPQPRGTSPPARPRATCSSSRPSPSRPRSRCRRRRP